MYKSHRYSIFNTNPRREKEPEQISFFFIESVDPICILL